MKESDGLRLESGVEEGSLDEEGAEGRFFKKSDVEDHVGHTVLEEKKNS